MTAPDEFTVGPDDHLVLISKTAIAPDELQRMVDRVPEPLRGRVLVVDGTTLDAKVIRNHAAAEAVYEEHPEHGRLFVGFQPRECGEHRTVGDYRAWCFDCGEWCYPNAPCVRCEISTLRGNTAVSAAVSS